MNTDQRPNDGIRFMERAAIVAIVVILLALFAIVGSIDFSEALIAEAIEKEARPARAAEDTVLAHPIPYDATITQYGDGITEPRTRYYIRPSKR